VTRPLDNGGLVNGSAGVGLGKSELRGGNTHDKKGGGGISEKNTNNSQ